MRVTWKVALAGVVALTLAGCPNDKGGGGGNGNGANTNNDNAMNRDSRTYENSNPVTRQQEHSEGVPLQAQPESGQAVSGKTGDEQVQNGKAQVATAQKVDVNSASVDQLATVPGIGHNLAEAIVNNRPYKNKEDLVRRIPNLDKRYVASFEKYITFGPSGYKGNQ